MCGHACRYWTCESSTLGGGHAIKMLARGDELSKANTFTVMMVPQVFGRKKDARQIFCLRSLHNGHLVSPNFRGRFHVNGVCTDGTLHRQENQFSVVHKTKKIKKKKGGPPGGKCSRVLVSYVPPYDDDAWRAELSRILPPPYTRNLSTRTTLSSPPSRVTTAKPSYKKLPVARFWHHQYNQWLYTHDSKVHRTPRIAMCGDAQHIGQATHYKFIWVSRGVTRRAKEEDLSAAAAAPTSPPPPPPSAAAAAAVAAGGL